MTDSKGNSVAAPTQALLQLCGLDNMPKRRKRQKWCEVTLKFIGVESYVLGAKRAVLSLTGSDGGFGLRFKETLVIQADSLLGNRIKHGLLTDVRIDFGKDSDMPELSLAQLIGGRYPIVLRAGDYVQVS